MKKFLAIYTGTPEAMARWDDLPETEKASRQKLGIEGWHAWADKHKSAIVEMGGPLGRTKRIGKDGITDIRNAMTAYTLVTAESHQDAANMFIDHPHFTIFPGEGIELMECMPIPSL
jgi:hypothetical protein